MIRFYSKTFQTFILIIFFGLVSFSPSVFSQEDEASEQEDSNWKVINVPFNYQNVQVPREVWETMKELVAKDGVGPAILEDFTVLPINLNFYIVSPDKRVLKDDLSYRLSFIEGGGDVDLFNFVTGKGPFHLKFTPEFPESGKMHLLYISDSPGKTVGVDEWGNGCGKLFDLSSKVAEFVGEEGIRVTSARRHYMHLMAGTFIFFQLIEDKLYLGYIRLKDTRYPNFSCSAET